MAALPSFVELMASLGLDQATPAPQAEQPPSQPTLTLTDSPRIGKNAPGRSSSSPSLRDVGARRHISRYSPYSSVSSLTRRRGSLSSVSSSSDYDLSPLSPIFSIPPRPSSHARRYRNKLTINTYGSSSDINGETPISTYVRRKSPGHSPTSPTFNPVDSGYESSSPVMPFSIPSLPMLLPHSASSESFPNTPTSDSDSGEVAPKDSHRLSDIKEGHDYYRFIRRRTGTRISTPPRSVRSEKYPRRKFTADLAA